MNASNPFPGVNPILTSNILASDRWLSYHNRLMTNLTDQIAEQPDDQRFPFHITQLPDRLLNDFVVLRDQAAIADVVGTLHGVDKAVLMQNPQQVADILGVEVGHLAV